MRHVTATVIAAVAMMTAPVLLAQTPMKPTAPGTAGDPVWQGVLRMSDGRTFVTDGGLALDASLAKPSVLPERQVAGKVLEGYLSAAHKEEFALSEVSGAAPAKTYKAPNGIELNATYINFLRRALPSGARLRTTAINEPIVIVVTGTAVGILMPVRQ